MTEVVRHKVVLCSGKASKAGETAFSTNSPTNLIPFKKENKLSNKYVFFNEQRCELFDREKHWAFVFYNKWQSRLHVQSPHYACLTEGAEKCPNRRGAFQKGLPELTYIVQNYRMSNRKVQNIDQQQGPLYIFSSQSRWGRLYIPYLLTASICCSLLNIEAI